LSLANRGPDDERIRVCVQGEDAEAIFWMDPLIELDQCYYGFNDDDLKVISGLLSAKEREIRAAWERFSTYGRKAQAKWYAKLEGADAV
jgi:hypothetical protein